MSGLNSSPNGRRPAPSESDSALHKGGIPRAHAGEPEVEVGEMSTGTAVLRWLRELRPASAPWQGRAAPPTESAMHRARAREGGEPAPPTSGKKISEAVPRDRGETEPGSTDPGVAPPPDDASPESIALAPRGHPTDARSIASGSVTDAGGSARYRWIQAKPPLSGEKDEAERQTQQDDASDSTNPAALNPPLVKYVIAALTGIGLLGTALTVARVLPLLPATQYGYSLSALAMFVREAGDVPTGTSQSQSTRVGWLLVWAAITIVGASHVPTFWLVFPFSAVFWIFTLAEWKCAAAAFPASSARGRARRRIATFKRLFRGRRGAGLITTVILAGATASIGTTMGAVALIAKVEQQRSKPVSTGTSTKSKRTGGTSKTPQVSTSPTGTTTAQASSEASGATAAPQQCAKHTYTEAPWASKQINELLETGAMLGPKEEGCVEKLKLEYEANDGFVWGIGLSLTAPGQRSSIVIDSHLFLPAIYIAPALGKIETLIHHYGLIGGTEKPFPRYRAGSGDFLLVNTAENGTCVLIRARSGAEYEAPEYQLLYPSEAVAWQTVMHNLHHWEWPTMAPTLNEAGEQVFNLTAAGASSPNAEITYNTTTDEAHWNGYGYPAIQRDLSPSELEQDVNTYLAHQSGEDSRDP